MARPPKLTPDLQKKACKLLAAGNTRADAALCAGVGASTLRGWLAEGRRQRRAGGNGKFLAFLAAVEKAEAVCRVRLVRCVSRAAVKNWKAASWLLGCKAPDEYGSDKKELALLRKEQAEMKKLLAERIAIPPPPGPAQGEGGKGDDKPV